MADIHGMGDFNNNNNNQENNRNYNPFVDSGNRDNSDNPFRDVTGFSGQGDPRKETFMTFLKNMICPKFSFLSFTFFILNFNLIIYIVTLAVGFDKTIPLLLSPSVKTLSLFGAWNRELLKKEKLVQCYRWVANSVLHANFLHILSNSISIWIFGSLTEGIITTWKIAYVYILSGILGSWFSMWVKPSYLSVGASISLYGIIGAYFMFCLLNWKSMERWLGSMGRCVMFYFLLFIVSFSLIISLLDNGLSKSNINVYGHLGGFIFGFLITPSVVQPKNEDDPVLMKATFWMYWSIGVCAVYAITGFLCFYWI